MADPLASFSDSPSAPARLPYAVEPDDAIALPLIPKGLYIGTGGDVTIRGIDAREDVTYKNLPDASYINVRVLYVRASGTTATDIVAEA